MEGSNGSSGTLGEKSSYTLKDTSDVRTTVNLQIGHTEFIQNSVVAGARKTQLESEDDSTLQSDYLVGNGRTGDTSQIGQDSSHTGRQIYIKMLLLCEMISSCFVMIF